MKVYVKGQGAVDLTKGDYVGGGGEGDVYVKGSTAFKVYHDRSRVIPAAKVQELSSIADPCINKPTHMLFDKANHPIGYTTRFIDHAHVLCELFPPAFRARYGIDENKTLDLVRKLQLRIQNVHAAGILVVDCNEMNWLVSAAFDEVYGIDVDSYQTRSFPATAIMPNIRDPQVQGLDWTEVSDWYSFAILSFNLFTGIHPFKGKHPTLKGFEERMRANVSVLNSAVSIPKVVLPFSVIPSVYMQWYEAVFERGRRETPPSDLLATITLQPVVQQVRGTNNIDITVVYASTSDILGVWEDMPAMLIWARDEVVWGNRPLYGPLKNARAVGFCSRDGTPVIAGTSQGNLKLFVPTTHVEIDVTTKADEVMSHNGQIYLRRADKFMRLDLHGGDKGILAVPTLVANCMSHASRLYSGVLLQDMLGSPWATLLPLAGKTYTMKLAELEGYRVVDAKFDNAGDGTGVLMVVGNKAGHFDRFIYRFSADYLEHDVRKVENVAHVGLNFVVLPSGVCVCLNEEDKLEVFAQRMGSQGLKLVDDNVLGGDMRLYKQGTTVLFSKGNTLYSMRLK